ncbi:MAG TPA: DUF6538 domain-containing protein [Xanthobacteraceae bacterium]|nr:DUF6538 domain-containing protein [Xanthobacteraceae bacterium]
MAFGRYLRRRAHTWYFRWRCPKRFASGQNPSEHIFSLKTGDYRCALHRARVLRLGLETLMTQFTPAMSRAEAEGRVRNWIDGCLWRHEAHRAETNGFELLETHEVERMGEEDARELDALLRISGTIYRDEQKKVVQRVLTGKAPLDTLAPVIDRAALGMGVTIDRTTADGRLLARTALRGYATLLDELQEAVADIPRQAQAAVANPVLPGFEFFTHWDEFIDTKRSDKKWKKDTASGAEATPRLFKDLIGDLPFAKINGDIVGRFRREYLKLPYNYFHDRKWKKLKPAKVVEEVGKLDETAKNKIRTTSTTTANKHVLNLIEYWDHLALHGKIPRSVDNAFRGHLTARPRGRAARDEHQLWPEDLNRTFFTSPLYNGCKSIHRRVLPGDEIHRDPLFWVPLFGRLMGVREDEICGRLVGDIEWIETEIGRVAYLKIRDSKTASSSRDVPIHKLLLELGFLEYRYYGRAADEPLFPELILQGVEPRRSGAFSGRFTEYRKKIKIMRRGIDFRSYRGNVETILRNTDGANPGWIDELIGHDSPVRRSEGARYTKSIFMANLKRTVDKVVIGVDLSTLYHSGPRGVQAAGSADDIARYLALAEREMNKKSARRRR